MATRSQIEKCISNAVSAFNAIIPNGNSITEEVEYVIAGSGGYAECLNKTVERLCATEKEYDSLTTAEVVIGSKPKVSTSDSEVCKCKPISALAESA